MNASLPRPSTPLEAYPSLRKMLYNIQWIANIVLAVMSFVFISLGMTPQWFIIVGGALNLVWTLTGITASGNTPPPEG